MLMPDTIASYKASDGVEYIVTANEGDDKEYEWETSNGKTVWTEMIRGKDMADAGLSVRSSAGVTDADLADQKKLGRIKCGWFDGRGSNFAEKKFDKIARIVHTCQRTRTSADEHTRQQNHPARRHTNNSGEYRILEIRSWSRTSARQVISA